MTDVQPAREKDDFYRTPEACTRALLGVERFGPLVWEPACGDGAISAVIEGWAGIRKVLSTDLVDHGYGRAGVDFLSERRLPEPHCDIVTNPPFRLADEFALHALALGARKVALLGRTAWLEGAARYRRLWSVHPPSRIWQFCKRQTLWRGDRESPGKGGTTAYAWFVWDRSHAMGGTQLGWLP